VPKIPTIPHIRLDGPLPIAYGLACPYRKSDPVGNRRRIDPGDRLEERLCHECDILR
jgi:hypothetical protein